MKLQIKNLDNIETLLILGTEKDKPANNFPMLEEQAQPKMYRYVLRPGEEKIFHMNENQVLGLDQL